MIETILTSRVFAYAVCIGIISLAITLSYQKYQKLISVNKSLEQSIETLTNDNNSLQLTISEQNKKIETYIQLRLYEESIAKQKAESHAALEKQLQDTKSQLNELIERRKNEAPNDQSVLCSTVRIDPALRNWMLAN
ncbi:hypothetical protein RVBP17_0800 [Pseudomonas phage sp. 30-3]|nr:hypothetical protein RVBP17_0800 [Pseudomonas phage sp. 30-3]